MPDGEPRQMTFAQQCRAVLSVIALPLPILQLYVGLQEWDSVGGGARGRSGGASGENATGEPHGLFQ